MLSIILIIYAVLGTAFILALAVAAHKPLPKESVRMEKSNVQKRRMRSSSRFQRWSANKPSPRRAEKWALN